MVLASWRLLTTQRQRRGPKSSLQRAAVDLLKRNEFVVFVVRLQVNPGFKAALDVHGGCRRADPLGGHKQQYSTLPKSHHTEAEP